MQFVKLLHPDRPVLTEVVAASEDEHADIRQLSILALEALGDLSLLTPLLRRTDDRVTPARALAALRDYIGRGPDASKRAFDQLTQDFGPETGALFGKILVGFTPEEATNPETYQRLVALLGPEQESVGAARARSRHVETPDRTRRSRLRSRPSRGQRADDLEGTPAAKASSDPRQKTPGQNRVRYAHSQSYWEVFDVRCSVFSYGCVSLNTEHRTPNTSVRLGSTMHARRKA